MKTGKRLKHRLVVDVTLDTPGTAKEAVQALQDHFKRAHQALTGHDPTPPLWPGLSHIHRPKEFSRVFRAELYAQIRSTPEYLGETG